jgi:hypothetical protein
MVRPATLRLVGAIAVSTILLLLPAIWNDFPLLQWDTGGYLARWYEGTIEESRSTVYGFLVYALQTPNFWPVVLLQSALTAWVLTLVLRVYGLTRPGHLLVAVGLLTALTSLPWLTSILLTDIFAGLAVLGFHLLVFEADRLGRIERNALVALVATATATHSATMVMILGLVALAGVGALLAPHLVRLRRVAVAAACPLLGAALLLAGNLAVCGRLAWTPGGFSILFARMLEDGIVKRYLEEHCPNPKLRLCRYRHELPATADEFLWGGGSNSLFNRLGRFPKMQDEMRVIALESLADYPVEQFSAAVMATARQLVTVGGGEGVVSYLPHSYGIIERFTPRWVPEMRSARQQHGEITLFPALNAYQVPLALGSLLVLLVIVTRALRRRGPLALSRIELLALVVVLALVCNAVVCGVFSNPHPRYGARLAWLAPLVVMIMLFGRLLPQWAAGAPPPAAVEGGSPPVEPA